MRSRNTIKAAVAAAGALLLAAGAQAAPLIQGWSHEKAAEAETLRLAWTESAEFEVRAFPSARQAVITIPGAALAPGAATDLALADGSTVERARLRPISLPDGSAAVQVALTLSEWAEPTATARDGELVLRWASASAAAPLVLTNADVEALQAADSFGSARAPRAGAGQPAGAGDAFAAFWIPPDLSEEQRTPDAFADFDEGAERTRALLARTVTLDFRNVPLQDVIRTMANAAGMNIIINPGQASQPITLSLTDVALGDAMEALLASQSLALREERGGIVRIVPRSSVRTAQVETVFRTISINWVDAGSLSRILQPFLSENGRIQFAQESNVLLIRDVPTNIEEIQRLIQRLDVPEKQVMMQLRLVDMTESAQRDLNMRSSFQRVGAKNEAVLPTGFTGTGTLPFSPGTLPVGTDLPALQGSIDAGLGLNIADSISIFGEQFNIAAALEASEERGEVITLANPRVLSLNNVQAQIDIKRQIPFVDGEVGGEGEAVRRVSFSDVGVSVRITPLITNHGYVRMDIQPTQRILVTSTGVAPTVDERSVNTSVIVRDEQTIALGGLRQFSSNTTEAGVPWLMRMPFFGWMFRNSSYLQGRVELFLFVTPSIIKDPEPTTYEMGIYEKIDYNWDLPDYFFDTVRPRSSPREAVDPTIRYH